MTISPLRAGALLLVSLALLSRSARAQQADHLVAPGANDQGAVPPSAIEERLQGVVRQYDGRSILRIAMFDAAFPRDSAEFAAMHGNALLLLVAVTMAPEDLPPTALTAVVGDQRVPLTPLVVRNYQVPAGTYGSVLGRYRTDGFYLVPPQMWSGEAQLVVEFPGRPGFVLGQMSPPDGIAFPPIIAGPPADSAIMALWAREFPGFPRR